VFARERKSGEIDLFYDAKNKKNETDSEHLMEAKEGIDLNT